jgi:type I thyroxine 5'-deiodinase
VPALNKLYNEYRDRAEFFVVYIQEAHPIDAWQLNDNIKDDVLVATTKTADERDNVAGVCLTKLGIELPAVIDEPDNRVERAYTGWPDRLYVIDRDGRVAYKSAAGPFGFKPAEVETSLKRLVEGNQRELPVAR